MVVIINPSGRNKRGCESHVGYMEEPHGAVQYVIAWAVITKVLWRLCDEETLSFPLKIGYTWRKLLVTAKGMAITEKSTRICGPAFWFNEQW